MISSSCNTYTIIFDNLAGDFDIYGAYGEPPVNVFFPIGDKREKDYHIYLCPSQADFAIGTFFVILKNGYTTNGLIDVKFEVNFFFF